MRKCRLLNKAKKNIETDEGYSVHAETPCKNSTMIHIPVWFQILNSGKQNSETVKWTLVNLFHYMNEI